MVGLAIILLVPALLFFGIRGIMTLVGNIGESSSSNEGSKRLKAIELEFGSSEYGYYDFLFSDDEGTDEVWFKYKPKSDRKALISVENLEHDYSIVLYDGRKELTRAIKGEELIYDLEKGNKYFVVVEINKNSYGYDDESYNDYNYGYDYGYKSIDREFNIKIGNPTPKGADADHAYTLELGMNPTQSYESLLPTKTYPEDHKSAFGNSAVSGDSAYSSEVWFKFTPSHASKYTFSLTDFASNASIYLYNYDDTDESIITSYNSNSLEYTLVGGKTYYYKVYVESGYDYGYSYSSGVESEFGVNMQAEPRGTSHMSAYELVLGSNASNHWEALDDGSEVWFKFSPENSGYYSFNPTGADSNSYVYVYEIETYPGGDYSSESVDYIGSSDYKYFYLDSDKVYYAKFELYGYCESFGVDVATPAGTSEENAIELPLDTNTYGKYIHSVHSGYLYFKFQPETDGIYTFSVVDASSGSYNLYLYQDYTSGSSIASAENENLSCQLYSDSVYYLQLCTRGVYSGEVDYNLEVKSAVEGSVKELAINIPLGETESQEWDALVDGDTIWFKFEPYTAGYYNFEATELYNGYDVNVYYVYNGESVSYIGSSDNKYFELELGRSYYIRIKLYGSESSMGINVSNLRGQDYDHPNELTLSETFGVAYHPEVYSSGCVWFSFMPEESGFYKFSASNSYYGYYMYLYEGYVGSYVADKYDDNIYYELDSNTLYYIQLSPEYSYTTNYLELCVDAVVPGETREAAIELTEEGFESQSWDVLNEQTYMYFKFTPDATGYYKFGTTGASPSIYVYPSLTTTSSMNSTYVNYEYGYYMSAGTTYYIEFSFSYYGVSFGVSLHIIPTGGSRAAAYKLGYNDQVNKGYSDSHNRNGEVWFTFTPDTTASYTFSLGNANSRMIYLYTGNNGSYTNSTSSSSLTATLYAGNTYYFLVDFTNYYDYDFYVYIY